MYPQLLTIYKMCIFTINSQSNQGALQKPETPGISLAGFPLRMLTHKENPYYKCNELIHDGASELSNWDVTSPFYLKSVPR